jgi:hypothetical protein
MDFAEVAAAWSKLKDKQHWQLVALVGSMME